MIHNTLFSMKFSVVIPVYNRENFIRRAVESALNQTRPAEEIIVVNDGSTDRTRNILNDYNEFIQIIDQTNSGVSSARNKGITHARYDWLVFLDSDDEWHRDKLLQAEKYHDKNPQYLVFQSDEIWIRNGKRANPKIKHQKYEGWIYKQCLPLCIVSPSAVVIHKNIFQDVGLFDENFIVCEDYDLWLRIARKYPIGLDPFQGLIKYGGHKDQLSQKYWGMDRYRIMAMEKQLDDPFLPDDLRKSTIQEIISKLDILIKGFQKRNKDTTELGYKIKKYMDELTCG